MPNNGVNMGKNNEIQAGGDITVENTVTIKKSHLTVGLTLTISMMLILVVIVSNPFRGETTDNILGKWVTGDGTYIEFLSDGTIETDLRLLNDSSTGTYEILTDEGYLKLGQFAGEWLRYVYSYWDMDINGSNMTLILKDDPNQVIELTK